MKQYPVCRLPVRSTCRRGVSTLWIILTLPVVLCLLGVIVEGGNVWLARLELSNAVEAAALAGVDTWGDEAPPNNPMARHAARNRAVELFAANTIRGQTFAMSPNGTMGMGMGMGASNNAVCGDDPAVTGNIVMLGEIGGLAGPSPYPFDATKALSAMASATTDLGVRVQARVAVNSLAANWCGAPIGPFYVKAHAVARYDNDRPKLIRDGALICP
jgi:hypothetical protein